MASYEYTPAVDEHKQSQVHPSVEGEQEYEEMVRDRLQISVERVECMGCKRGWY